MFRNNLTPGQYPYPFWHDAKKWNDYERANGLTLWIDPYTAKIVVGQFSRQEDADPRLNTVSRVPPAFDGKWMWVDGNGEPQPKPTLFVGLFRADNPYLEQLQTNMVACLVTSKRSSDCCDGLSNSATLRRDSHGSEPIDSRSGDSSRPDERAADGGSAWLAAIRM